MMSMKVLMPFLLFCFMLACQPSVTGAFLFEAEEDADEPSEETSFMQVGISAPRQARRVTGRSAVEGEEEEEEEESAFFQSSLKKTSVNERQEEFESDEFSM
eukprot:TRINITY_DN1775_c2_g1_i1.p2 TRINITY_DN1775_c2_g1~~TRINITY_DN1775_c2_g1_i1.p2  ORF type:complete len:102 (+),score=32.61 TRINITY_DN1775_c2_g1_i1:234-539(+)